MRELSKSPEIGVQYLEVGSSGSINRLYENLKEKIETEELFCFSLVSRFEYSEVTWYIFLISLQCVIVIMKIIVGFFYTSSSGKVNHLKSF